MWNVKGKFCINGEKYVLFIEKRLFRVKVSLFKEQNDSFFLEPIPIKIKTSTPKEHMEYWQEYLKRKYTSRRKKSEREMESKELLEKLLIGSAKQIVEAPASEKAIEILPVLAHELIELWRG